MAAGKKKLTREQRRMKKIWKVAKPVLVFFLSTFIVVFVVRFGLQYVLTHYIKPVDERDATPIEVVIPKNSSASRIAHILYSARGENEPGLIQNTAIFKVYVDFVGKASKMQEGTYILSRNMTMKQIVDIICEGNPPKPTVSFTIPEGYTSSDIAAVLREKGFIDSQAEFLIGCNDASLYSAFSFLTPVIQNPNGRSVLLEGYLFPDTYEVYEDATVDSIAIRMLNRFNEVFTDEYAERAAELGMTMDQVVILASLIEREAQVKTDFPKVSAVFHNRLNQDMPLQSCASLSYVLKVNKYTFTESELQTDSPYNTYQNAGLPIGPISNPGRTAIEAALYPNEAFINDGYLYFCNGNPNESKELVFSKTYKEHQKNVKKYQKYWS